jgi:hypothetical protein
MSGVIGYEYDYNEDESYHSDDGEGGQCSLCRDSNPKRYYNITKLLPTRRRYCPNFRDEYHIETSRPEAYPCYKIAEENDKWVEFECVCGGQNCEEEFVITICKSCYREKYFI